MTTNFTPPLPRQGHSRSLQYVLRSLHEHLKCLRAGITGRLQMLLLLLLPLQMQASGTIAFNTSTNITGTRTTTSETLFIGPDAVITVSGTWNVFSSNIFIHPDAIIASGGVINFYDRSLLGGSSAPIVIDGNNNTLDVAVNLHNSQGMILADIEDPGYGGTFPSGSSEAALRFGVALNLMEDGANVSLNGSNLIFAEDAIITGYSPERMIITGNSASAHLIKEDLSSGFTFPIGIAAGDYTPARVEVTNGSSAVFVSVTDHDNSGATVGPTEMGVGRVWQVFGDAEAEAILYLQHNEASAGDMFDDEDGFITRYIGEAPNEAGGAMSSTAWDLTLAASAGSGEGTLTSGDPILDASVMSRTITLEESDGISFYSKSLHRTSAPLPVELLYFTVNKSDQDALLSWATASELNNDGFDIERSRDAISFEKIGFVAGQGTTSLEQRYTYTDVQPGAGLFYYRLKQVDYDGSFEYSPIRSVEFDQSFALSLFPNPTYGPVTLISEQPLTLMVVIDAAGRLVHSEQLNNEQSFQRQFGHLAAGAYVISLFSGEQKAGNFTLIIQK